MEGELRRLAERAQQDQHHHESVAAVGPHQLPGGPQLGDGEGAGHEPQQHQAGQHRQFACDRHDERLLCRQPGRADGVLEADEQVGGDAGQAPEHDQQQQIVGQHQAQHGGHEGQRQGMETVDLGVPVEVALGIEDDGRADAADEEREE